MKISTYFSANRALRICASDIMAAPTLHAARPPKSDARTILNPLHLLSSTASEFHRAETCYYERRHYVHFDQFIVMCSFELYAREESNMIYCRGTNNAHGHSQAIFTQLTPSFNPIQCSPVVLISNLDATIDLYQRTTLPNALFLALELQIRAIPLETVSLPRPVDGVAHVRTGQR